MPAPKLPPNKSCDNSDVSVVLAAHNAGRFLQDALDSVLAQTLRDFELVVIDDGSNDNTARILDRYVDPRIRVIRLEQNRGLVQALNVGIRIARSPLIARMDADDVCEPDRLRVQCAFMASHPEALACGTGVSYIDARGRIFGGHCHPSSNEELQALILDHNPICHPSVIMRTEAVRAVGGYRDLGGAHAQDYDLFLRLAERGEIANLPARLLRYRYHCNQITHSKLLSQVRAAETYKGLARQRRAGRAENLAEIMASPELGARAIEARTAAAYGSLSLTYLDAGSPRAAFGLLLRAVAMRPANPAVLLAWCRHAWRRKLRGTRRVLRWYVERIWRLLKKRGPVRDDS